MRRLRLRPVIALSLILLAPGCAQRAAAARGVAALGVLTIAAGLLIAGDCEETHGTQDQSSVCSGTPDGDDMKGGLAVAAAGVGLVAAGMAMEPPERHAPRVPAPAALLPAPLLGPRTGAEAAPLVPEEEREELREQQALPAYGTAAGD
ncbi:MAG: hypothetical protein RL385_2989 [Pseudomonadota bacterium]|jgi:hypothetical protein